MAPVQGTYGSAAQYKYSEAMCVILNVIAVPLRNNRNKALFNLFKIFQCIFNIKIVNENIGLWNKIESSEIN